MVEKIGHVRNPLTVIAIFAALAEVSGTVVLPLLSQTTQEKYVWFLMGFPLFLVAVFFFVLFKKHHVLYAPSDFHDDKTFKELFENVSVFAKVDKLNSETEAISETTDPEEVSQQSLPTSSPVQPAQDNETFVRSFRGNGLLAEELVVAKLSKDMDIKFERDVALRSNPRVVFDAIAFSESRPVVLEVRFTRAWLYPTNNVDEYFNRASKFLDELPDSLKNKVSFVYAIVTDREDRAERIERTATRIREKASTYPFKTTVITYSLKDLEKEIECARR
jgi:hypothetical protein